MTNDSSQEPGVSRAQAPWGRTPRIYVLVGLGVLLAFDVLFYLIAIRPLSARELRQQLLVSGLAEQVEQSTARVENLRIIVEKVERARTEGDALLGEITLARRTTFSTLVTELIEAAEKSGIENRESSFDLDPIEGAEQYGVMTITANFRGEYENLVKLLNRLDRSEKFLIIGSLGATPRSDSTELQITMKIDTFVRDL